MNQIIGNMYMQIGSIYVYATHSLMLYQAKGICNFLLNFTETLKLLFFASF